MVYRPPLIVPFGSDGKVPPTVKTTIAASSGWWAAANGSAGSPYSVDPATVTDFNDPGTAVAEAVTLAPGGSQPTAGRSTPTADVAAGAIIDSYGTHIRQFIATQRQAVGLSDLPIHRRMITFAGLDVFYMSQQGREAINYVVRPERAPAGSPPDLLDLGGIAVEFFSGAS